MTHYILQRGAMYSLPETLHVAMGRLLCQCCVNEGDTGNIFTNHIMLSCIAALVPVAPHPTLPPLPSFPVELYPSTCGCRMNEGSEGSVVNMYAQLDSQEMPIPKDLSDYWQDPSSYFLIPGDHILPSTAPKTSPQCRNAFLLSPDVSEFRFLV